MKLFGPVDTQSAIHTSLPNSSVQSPNKHPVLTVFYHNILVLHFLLICLTFRTILV
jgi:hypothetical protein